MDVYIYENLEKILKQFNQRKGFTYKENLILFKNNVTWKV
jgi:hypothetical protein